MKAPISKSHFKITSPSPSSPLQQSHIHEESSVKSTYDARSISQHRLLLHSTFSGIRSPRLPQPPSSRRFPGSSLPRGHERRVSTIRTYRRLLSPDRGSAYRRRVIEVPLRRGSRSRQRRLWSFRDGLLLPRRRAEVYSRPRRSSVPRGEISKSLDCSLDL